MSERPWKGRTKVLVAIVILIIVVGSILAYFAFLAGPLRSANRPPELQGVSADRPAADTGQAITFTVSAQDPDGDALTYTWDFGDNSSWNGTPVTHSYLYPGNYIAIVTVSDGRGGVVTSDASPVFVRVNPAERPHPGASTEQPSPVAVLSVERSFVRVNETVRFNGNSSWTWAYGGASVGWTFQPAAANGSAIPALAYDFGDGGPPVTGAPRDVGEVRHTFTGGGSHFVRLVAVNHLGKADFAGYTVRVTDFVPSPAVPKNPDVFTSVVFGEPESLDPAFGDDASSGEVVQNVAETLVWYDRDRADVLKPMLATKVPNVNNPADVSPDGKTYNFTLRSGLWFHSGNPVTCAGVEFSIERVLRLSEPEGPARMFDRSLTGGSVDDPATPEDERLIAIRGSVLCPDGPLGLKVQFRLASPYPAFLATLATPEASVIDPDPDSYRVTGRCPSADLASNHCHDQLVATGPFKLRLWHANQRIILDRNDNYWNLPASLNEVHIVKAFAVSTRILMLTAGDADRIDLPLDDAARVRDSAGNLLPGIQEQVGDTFAVHLIGFNRNINVSGAGTDVNVPSTFFADAYLRRAFSYAWNYLAFIQDTLHGYGTTLCSPVPRGMLGHDSTVPCFARDLVKAQAEFQMAADTRSGRTGSYWDNGFNLTIYYNVGNRVRESGARLLKTTLEAMNPGKFVIDVRGLERSSFEEVVRSEIPALIFFDWSPDYADPDGHVRQLLQSDRPFAQRIGYWNGSLDTMIDQQAQETDLAVRLVLLREIQHSVYDDVPYLWTYLGKHNQVMRTWVTGWYGNPMTTSGTGDYFYDYDK